MDIEPRKSLTKEEVEAIVDKMLGRQIRLIISTQNSVSQRVNDNLLDQPVDLDGYTAINTALDGMNRLMELKQTFLG